MPSLPSEDDALAPLGLSSAATSLYRRLLQDPVAEPEPSEAWGELAAAGLVLASPDGRWTVPPPELALEPHLHEQLDSLLQVHAAVQLLRGLYQRYRPDASEPAVRLLTGEAVPARAAQLLAASAGVSRCLLDDRHPARARWFPGLDTLSARGQLRLLMTPATGPTDAAPMHAPGLTIRLTSQVGTQMLLSAGSAVLPLPATTSSAPAAAVEVSCAVLVAAMTELFELQWHRAAKLGLLPAPDRVLLRLLASGLTDESIARHLGVARRTAQRRVADLGRRLGAHGRVEIVRVASRAGLLDPEPSWTPSGSAPDRREQRPA